MTKTCHNTQKQLVHSDIAMLQPTLGVSLFLASNYHTDLAWSSFALFSTPISQELFSPQASLAGVSLSSSQLPNLHCNFCLCRSGSAPPLPTNTPALLALWFFPVELHLLPSRTYGGQPYRCYCLNRKQSRYYPPEPVKGPETATYVKASPTPLCMRHPQTFTIDHGLYYSLGSLTWLSNTPLSVVLPNMFCLLIFLNS